MEDSKAVISDESAQATLDELLDYYEIDVALFPADQTKIIEAVIGRLKKAIRLGRMEINVPEITQHLKHPPGKVTSITYSEVDGKAKLAMRSKQDTDHYGRMYALLGAMSGWGEASISQLKSVDISLAESLGTLFLQV